MASSTRCSDVLAGLELEVSVDDIVDAAGVIRPDRDRDQASVAAIGRPSRTSDDDVDRVRSTDPGIAWMSVIRIGRLHIELDRQQIPPWACSQPGW